MDTSLDIAELDNALEDLVDHMNRAEMEWTGSPLARPPTNSTSPSSGSSPMNQALNSSTPSYSNPTPNPPVAAPKETREPRETRETKETREIPSSLPPQKPPPATPTQQVFSFLNCRTLSIECI